MRKIAVALGICLMALAFGASPVDAKAKRPLKRSSQSAPTTVKAPQLPAPQGFCIPPGAHC